MHKHYRFHSLHLSLSVLFFFAKSAHLKNAVSTLTLDTAIQKCILARGKKNK